jgi:hypothetical protein
MNDERFERVFQRSELESAGLLLRLIGVVQRRMRLLRTVRYGLLGLALGVLGALVLLVVSRYVPLLQVRNIAGVVTCSGLVAGVLVGAMLPLRRTAVARQMDDYAGDAIATALEHLTDESAVARMQRTDAAARAEAYVFELRKQLPLPWRERTLQGVSAVCAVCLIGSAVLWLNPGAMDERARAIAAVQADLADLYEQIDVTQKALEAMRSEEDVTDEEEDELQEMIDQMNQLLSSMETELSGVETMEAAQDMQQRFESTLERIEAAGQDMQQRREQVAESLQSEPELSELGEAVERGDTEALQKAMEQLSAGLSAEDAEATAQALQRAAQDSSEPLSSQLSSLAGALGSQDPQQMAEAAAAIEAELNKLMTAEELATLAEQMLAQLGSDAGAPADPSGGVALGSPDDMQGSAGADDTPGATAAEGTEGTDSPPAAEGSGDGTDAEPNGEPGGEGTAEGSGAEPSSGGSSGGGRTTSGSGTMAGGAGAGLGAGKADLVTTPRKFAGTGEVTSDNGAWAGSGVTQSTGSAPALPGTARPYKEVYSDYLTEARQSMSRSALPQRLQSRIRDYFQSIEPE